jgi:cytochrome c oxidase subunit 2
MTDLLNKAKRLFMATLFLGAPMMAFAAVEPEKNWYTMPRDMSEFGHRSDWLIDITSVFSAILFIIMCVWMTIAYTKHTNGAEVEYDHGNGRKQILKAGLLSSFIFLLVDGNLFYNAMKDLDEAFWNFDGAVAQGWHFAEGESPPNHDGTIRIEINAHQWAWDARYAGPDGKFRTPDDIVTLNDIRVPENKTVYIQLASSDVIHSFSLPNFRVKQDAMPGMINHMLVHTAEESAGEYDIACAQHCGAGHYLMKGLWTVHSESDFDAWAAETSQRSELAYQESNVDSHWGWDWKEK